MELAAISRELSQCVDRLAFREPVTHVYNPLTYARAPHEAYLERYGRGKKRVLLIGMNPGPFGMAQTGVPFGDVDKVRRFLGIEGPVGLPRVVHPKRPVLGFRCSRPEVSGTRLWGWAEQRFGSAELFFRGFFVWNYCPLVFMTESGKNHTPDKLPPDERDPLFAVCDQALRAVVAELQPEIVIGVGAFAERRAQRLQPEFRGTLGTILHPSPASPLANRGWAEHIEAQLRSYGALPG